MLLCNSDQISSIIIPASVNTIEPNAFDGCSVTGVSFESGIQLLTIPADAFWGTGLTSIIIPASVTTIGHDAFEDCSQLTSVTFRCGTSALSIDNNSFYNTGVSSLALPSTAM